MFSTPKSERPGFLTEDAANGALVDARKYRPFLQAKIEMVQTAR